MRHRPSSSGCWYIRATHAPAHDPHQVIDRRFARVDRNVAGDYPISREVVQALLLHAVARQAIRDAHILAELADGFYGAFRRVPQRQPPRVLPEDVGYLGEFLQVADQVVAHHLGQQDGDADAVRDLVVGPYGHHQGVREPQARRVEGQGRRQAGEQHVRAGLEVLAGDDGRTQRLGDELHSPDGERLGDRLRRLVHVRLQGVGQRVYPRGRRDVRRQGERQLGVAHGDGGRHVGATDAVLDLLLLLGDNGPDGHLAPCAGRRRQGYHWDARIGDEVLSGVVADVALVLEHDGYRLGAVQGAPAPDTHDRVATLRAGELHPVHDAPRLGLGLDVAEEDVRHRGVLQRVGDLVDHPGVENAGVGDEEGAGSAALLDALGDALGDT